MAGMKPLTLIIFIFFSILFLFTFLTSGNTIHIVLSDSMAPTYFTGDLVTIDTRYEPNELKNGDVILYKLESREITVIHRIYDVHVENGVFYFAVMGDANDQPDFIEEQEGVINKKITIEFHEEDETFELNVTASYYSREYIIGRVIHRFPSAGWIFVPFYSYWQPFTLIAVLAIIGIVFFGLYRLNKYLNENFDYLFRIFRHKSGNLMLNGEVSARNLVLLLVFAGVFMGMFMVATMTSGSLTRSIELKTDGFSNANAGELLNATYIEDIKQVEVFYHNSNISAINYQLDKVENRLHIHKVNNYSILLPDREADGIETLDYEVVLDQDFFITGTTSADRLGLHTFPEYAIPIESYSEQAGYAAGGYYYTATTGTYYHYLTSKEYQVLILTREYHFIQNLFVYDGSSLLYFDLETGFLISEFSILTLEPWPIPDLSAVIFSVGFGSFYYWIAKKRKETVLKNKFLQMMTNLPVQPEEVIIKPLNGSNTREYGDQQESADDKENEIDS